MVAVVPSQVALEINLKFLCWFGFDKDPLPKYVWISEVVEPIDVFDSCKINPSTGGLAIVPPEFAGITYLNL